MRKNVYIKSMLRQPLHSLILIFLLFLATFSFVLRSVEFLSVRDQIFRVAKFYHSIGFLSVDHEFDIDDGLFYSVNRAVDREFYDVSLGADIIENSRYIELIDRRRGVESFLQGVLNADVGWTNFFWMQVEFDQWQFQEAFFYGELIDKIEFEGGWRLILTVDEVLVGYPEHVVSYQEKLQMDFDLEEGDESAIANMEIGERYFLRGAFSPFAPPFLDDPQPFGLTIPRIGDERIILLMLPLDPDGLWYIPVPYGEMVDFMELGLEHILEEVELMNRRHHAIQLRTTQDMSLIPFMLEDAEMGFIVDGRPIDQEDHLNENPVTVIHRQFALIRDLSIGDTITVRIPPTNHTEDGIVAYYVTNTAFVDPFYEVRVESISQDVQEHEIELEIVGVYNLFQRWGGDPDASIISTFIYVPESILPDDVITSPGRFGDADAQAYLPSQWFSFVLRSSRYEDAFIAEVRAPLEEMGLTVTMIDSGSDNFWMSANVILQSIMFNGIVFSVVLILILMFVTFLFLRQRRKEFAVSRMLGYSTGRSVREVLFAAALFLVPITIGSILAWLFARRTIVNTLLIFEELHDGYEALFSLSPLWLIGFVAIVFILTMLMVLIGAVYLMRRPVLELLQLRGKL